MSGYRKGKQGGGKWCVARHRSMPAKEADRCERAIERVTRQEARRDIERQLSSIRVQHSGRHGNTSRFVFDDEEFQTVVCGSLGESDSGCQKEVMLDEDPVTGDLFCPECSFRHPYG